MKTIPLLVLSMAIPAFAGTSAKETVAPAEEPCIFTWFTGASVGYLTEFEEPIYNIHFGTDTCWKPGGWNVSFFLEAGYTEKDDSWSGFEQSTEFPGDAEFDGDLDDLEDDLSELADDGFGDTGYDLDIIPITLNVKLERPLTGNLNAYIGSGLGAALVDLSVDAGTLGSLSGDEWVLVGQIFAGLNYNFNPSFEMYGGARWIYFDDADFGDVTLDLGDDFLLEIGARLNF